MGIYSWETWKQNTSRTITSNNIAHKNPVPYTIPQYIYKYTTKLLYDRSEKPQPKVALEIVLLQFWEFNYRDSRKLKGL